MKSIRNRVANSIVEVGLKSENRVEDVWVMSGKKSKGWPGEWQGEGEEMHCTEETAKSKV